uniref:SAM-dependent methyltransferase n=1 Tax=Haemonchus placei TaxID=6290 RepID=A0A0N4WVT0_HAEPC
LYFLYTTGERGFAPKRALPALSECLCLHFPSLKNGTLRAVL